MSESLQKIDDLAVLDTLTFKNQGIFLKNHHAQRSFEALASQKAPMTDKEIYSFYDEVEKEFSPKMTPKKILRILFHKKSNWSPEVEITDIPNFPASPRIQIISSMRCPFGVGEQNFKWNHRPFWDQILKLKIYEADDVVAVNERGNITETSRFNIFFFDQGNDRVLTPAIDSGCINGVYRRHILEKGHIQLPAIGTKNVIESSILATDAKKYTIFLANSVREVIPAQIL